MSATPKLAKLDQASDRFGAARLIRLPARMPCRRAVCLTKASSSCRQCRELLVGWIRNRNPKPNCRHPRRRLSDATGRPVCSANILFSRRRWRLLAPARASFRCAGGTAGGASESADQLLWTPAQWARRPASPIRNSIGGWLRLRH